MTSSLPPLPDADRDYVREARAMAALTSHEMVAQGMFPGHVRLLAYEHFVRTLLDVNAEQADLLADVLARETEAHQS